MKTSFFIKFVHLKMSSLSDWRLIVSLILKFWYILKCFKFLDVLNTICWDLNWLLVPEIHELTRFLDFLLILIILNPFLESVQSSLTFDLLCRSLFRSITEWGISWAWLGVEDVVLWWWQNLGSLNSSVLLILMFFNHFVIGKFSKINMRWNLLTHVIRVSKTWLVFCKSVISPILVHKPKYFRICLATLFSD